MHEQNLALSSLQWLICHKTQLIQTNLNQQNLFHEDFSPVMT